MWRTNGRSICDSVTRITTGARDVSQTSTAHNETRRPSHDQQPDRRFQLHRHHQRSDRPDRHSDMVLQPVRARLPGLLAGPHRRGLHDGAGRQADVDQCRDHRRQPDGAALCRDPRRKGPSDPRFDLRRVHADRAHHHSRDLGAERQGDRAGQVRVHQPRPLARHRRVHGVHRQAGHSSSTCSARSVNLPRSRTIRAKRRSSRPASSAPRSGTTDTAAPSQRRVS